MAMKRAASFCMFVVTVGSVGSATYWMHHRALQAELAVARLERSMGHTTEHLQNQIEVAHASVMSAGPEGKEHMSPTWRTVQDRVHNAVVQVFAQILEIDILEPYKTPSQHGASGSGFFIDEEGYLITNAHVVNQASSIWIQIPSLGKHIIDVDLVGLSPERDLALLKVRDADLELIKRELGSVTYLTLGNSDTVRRADDVLALGYPLGQQSLKSTTGVISGREHHYIQMSAPINPGSSGGPLLNMQGDVVGINAAGVTSAQNVGYIIPVNDLKNILADLHQVKLLRKPYLGVFFNNATPELTEELGNPQPGGCYVVEVVEGSSLYKAGVQSGDMLYEIDGNKIDMYGDMMVRWTEDKISITDYVSRLSAGAHVDLVFYRNGKRQEVAVKFDHAELPAIHTVHPAYEPLDYEVIAGMVVMSLTRNHIHALCNSVPGITRFAEMKNQAKQTLVITHIFPSSYLYRTRSIAAGSTINELNGKKVSTLAEFRAVMKEAGSEKFLKLKVSDNVSRTSDNVLAVLSMEKVLDQELQLAREYRYQLSESARELLKAKGIIS